MRFVLFAAALFTVATAAAAQESPQAEMDRAESELRTQLAPAGAPSAEGVAIERRSRDEIVVSMASDITFGFNRADVRYEFIPNIRSIARTISGHPSMVIDVVGHADAVGSDYYNQELSERRARAVGAELMDFGVPYDHVITSGRGEWDPIASNSTEWGRARNRRVEIHIKTKPKY